MKKLFILSFASILLLTGCGATETLSCTYSADANNGNTKVTYDIDHEEDEIKKVRITYKYDFSDNNGDNTGNGGNAGADNGTGDNGAATANNARIGGNDDTTGGNNDTTGGNNSNNNTGTGTNTTTEGNSGITGNTGNGTNTNNGNTTAGDANGTSTYNNDNHTDGVGTGTDGTTSDTNIDDDGVVDGVVGSAIDTIVGGVTGIILDSAGLRDRHANVQNTYGNVTGFSVQNTNDANNNYSVTYVIDYDTISDTDLANFNLTRNLDDMRTNYVNQGFTCK